jgi:hypothetical protein
MLIKRFKFALAAGTVMLVGGGVAVSQLPASGASVACTRLASSSGDDSAAGTPAAPWRTEGKMISSLQPGEVGCFAAGQSFGSPSQEFDLLAADVTIQSAPGTPATLVGLLVIGGARDIAQGLTLDGHNTLTIPGNPATAQGQAGLFMTGDDVVVRNNNISNGHTAICIFVGGANITTMRPVLDGNRVHACGILPHTRLEHGIYVDNAQGMRITNNLFYDIADYGVHLYPHASNTLVEANLIDTTGIGGVIIASEADGTPSSGNTIRRNIITNNGGPAVLTYWGGSPGTGNVAIDNCTANNVFVQSTYAGLTVQSEKAVSDPGFDSNYMLRAGAGCLGYGPSWIQPGGTTAPPPAPPVAPPVTKPPAGGGGVTTPPRGGQAMPVTPTGGVTTTTATHSASAIAITSPLTGGTPAAKQAGVRAKTFSFTLRWKGKASKTYQVRLDKHHWLSVKGRKHTFKHLRAGKHKVTVRLKGTRGHATTRIITVG